jgi:hypothetical protein
MSFTANILTAKDAIARHMQWRIALQFAITIQEALSTDQFDEIQHDERCAIGRWLVSSATKKIRATAELENLVRAHYRFHREMEVVAQLLSEGKFEQANRAIGSDSDFQEASHEIAMAIMAVDRLLVMAVPT